jgi:sugar phosphate isomerase/epimerase
MLPALAASGVTTLEISTPPRHFDVWEPGQIEALAGALQQWSLRVVSIHAPFGGLLDLADPNPHHRMAAVGAIVTAASAVKKLGGSLVVVHPSDLERHRHDAAGRVADCARSLATLAENFRALGVTIAVESPLPHLIGGHPDEFAAILDSLDDSVRVCLDTGHTALGRHWRRFVEVAGARLIHVHAHDNRGHWDDHLPPGDGSIDWAEVRQTLEDAGFTGSIMLELACPPSDPESYFRRAVEQAVRLFGC